MTTPRNEQPRTARFFTGITRIPLLIGKAGNSRLPGGPYTPAQFVVGALVLAVGWKTMPLWGPMAGSFPLIRILALVVASAFALWASGQLPSSRRKIHNLAFDAASVMTAPAAGKLNGRPVRLPAPHRVTGTVLIEADPFEELVEMAAALVGEGANVADESPLVDESPLIPASETTEPQSPVVSVPSFASGLDRLLEQARVKEG